MSLWILEHLPFLHADCFGAGACQKCRKTMTVVLRFFFCFLRDLVLCGDHAMPLLFPLHKHNPLRSGEVEKVLAVCIGCSEICSSSSQLVIERLLQIILLFLSINRDRWYSLVPVAFWSSWPRAQQAAFSRKPIHHNRVSQPGVLDAARACSLHLSPCPMLARRWLEEAQGRGPKAHQQEQKHGEASHSDRNP